MVVVNLTSLLYFAYGSNLLLKRIHENNPLATRAGIAKLEKHRLDFLHWSKRWKGACATVVPDNVSNVWGALWINIDTQALDNQEGVSRGVYKVYRVRVEMPNGTTVECRSYHLIDQPPKLEEGEAWPEERKPSQVYLNTIISGAKESGLPAEYVRQLETIPHNGYNVTTSDYDTHCGNNKCSSGDSLHNGDNKQANSKLWLLAPIYILQFNFKFNAIHIFIKSKRKEED